MSQRLPARFQPPPPPSPTGWALLTLVRKQGFLTQHVRAHGSHEQYLKELDTYIGLLQIAERDAICAPILITEVQTVLDEEARAGGLPPRIDKPL